MDQLYIYELNDTNNDQPNEKIYPNIIIKTQNIEIKKSIWNYKKKHKKQNKYNKPYTSIYNNNIYDSNNRLFKAKNQIDSYYNKKDWDCVKKITNPFEMIYITSKFNKNNSISLYEPLSRSYFKMIEIIHEFLDEYNPLIYKNNIKTLHLAEGPGGFMEAFINYRNNKNDLYYGITLKSTNNNIPGWNKSSYFINKNKNLNLITGIDNKGDLYNINNHYYIMNRLGRNTIDIITGDGGFDFSVDYNMQEELAQKLIYSQIIMAFSMLKIGGTFICKLFDTFLDLTQEFIFLLNLFYDKVYIYKPYTSRIANSERYIICKGYKGIKTLYLYELIQVLDLWNDFDNINKTNKDDYYNYNFRNSNCNKRIILKSILNINDDYYNSNIQLLYRDFKKKIKIINDKFQDIQIENINKTINIIKYPPNHKWYIENCKEQLKIAIQWCKKYNVPHKSFIYNLNYKVIYDM
jgi:23S rRNA U2552 (ribose-2'-O)-methylase RlmE/FtsJ